MHSESLVPLLVWPLALVSLGKRAVFIGTAQGEHPLSYPLV